MIILLLSYFFLSEDSHIEKSRKNALDKQFFDNLSILAKTVMGLEESINKTKKIIFILILSKWSLYRTDFDFFGSRCFFYRSRESFN